MRRLFMIQFLIIMLVSSGAAQPVFNNTLQQHLAEMPLLPTEQLTAGQFSSHSPHQRNGDVRHVLYQDTHGDAVLFEAYGPGRVTSVWGTVIDSASILKFYFDEEPTPRYSINAIDFYKGNYPSINGPLATYDRRGYYIEDAYAGNNFAPIYFENKLTITLQGKPTFYHVLYEKKPSGNKWNDAQRAQQLAFLKAAMTTGDTDEFKEIAPEKKQISLDAHKSADLLRKAGSGSVQWLEIEADSSSNFLKDVYVQMIWDDAAFDQSTRNNGPVYEMSAYTRISQVFAPIGIFFGSPHVPLEVKSLPIQIKILDSGRIKFICRFAMPYWKNARISLVNRSGNTYNNITSTIRVDATPYPEQQTGYFTTHWRKGLTEYGRDWLFVETQGTGKFMGAVQSARLEHYCEGNEHFYIDGNRTPQINGTGTEDYYLGCFWPNMVYHSAFAGCVNDVRLMSGGDPTKWTTIFKEDYYVPAVYYRFHVDMPIPFYSGIDARIQHGPESTIQSEYESLAYLYLRNSPVLTETDFIDLGSATSKKLHQYRSKGIEVQRSAHYEGNYLNTAIRDAGLQHSNTPISFTVAVAKNNQGVRLRRRMDQSAGQQSARVYVNGTYAGTWTDPQKNDILQWYDSEFDIPAALTNNSEQLQIKLVPNGKNPFNDFEYRVLSYLKSS